VAERVNERRADRVCGAMPYTRRQPRIAGTGAVSIRLSPAQRDLLMTSPHVPQEVGHLLHRATVRDGKLVVRLRRDALDALITAAARAPAPDHKAERDLDALLRYLEAMADRFEPVGESEEA